MGVKEYGNGGTAACAGTAIWPPAQIAGRFPAGVTR
jgi:hypothetical protein